MFNYNIIITHALPPKHIFSHTYTCTSKLIYVCIGNLPICLSCVQLTSTSINSSACLSVRPTVCLVLTEAPSIESYKCKCLPLTQIYTFLHLHAYICTCMCMCM